MKRSLRLLYFLSLVMIVAAVSSNSFAATFQDDQSKSIRASEYLKKRPAPEKPAANSPPKNINPVIAKERQYRFVKAKKTKKARSRAAVRTMENASIGFTLWRLRDTDERDESKGFEVNKGKRQKLIRAESDSPLQLGEAARIVIESPTHDGYLYVINREKFADGTYGVAKLIFPTLDANGGNNFVKAGILTFIPPLSGDPFVIESRTERMQDAEELTIIVSPKPLIESSRLREDAIPISTDLLTEWIKLYEVDEVQRELEDGVGLDMTIAEQNAGREQSKGFESKRMLTRDDPPPQTVFDMKIKRGNPFMTRILLKTGSD